MTDRSDRLSPLVVLVSSLVLIVAACGVTVLVWGGDRTVAGEARPLPCPLGIAISFQTDADMTTASERLRGDGRFESLKSETKLQAYQRFKEIFKDKPNLMELARPEAMSASVIVTGHAESELRPLESALRTEFPAANSVRAVCPWLAR